MEALDSKGILLSPTLTVTTGDLEMPPSPVCSPTDPPRRKADTTKWKAQHKASTLPLNLISATNQQKVLPNVQIRQQLPLKLATRLGSGSPTSGGGPQQMLPLKLSSTTGCSGGSGGYQRLASPPEAPPPPSHTRTGSSPAMMQNVQVSRVTILRPSPASLTWIYYHQSSIKNVNDYL